MIINTTATINGSIDEVWRKLTDFASFPRWNRFMTRIEGEQVVGARLSVDITPPGAGQSTFTPVLTRFAVNEEMRWVGVLGAPWVFRGEHYFRLERLDADRTRLTHGEEFTGLLAPLLLCLIGKKTLAGFNLMNQGLTDVIAQERLARASAATLMDTDTVLPEPGHETGLTHRAAKSTERQPLLQSAANRHIASGVHAFYGADGIATDDSTNEKKM